MVGADAAVPAVQALVRWDAAGFAARELAERAAFGFPPATRLASLTGAPAAVAELLEVADLPPGAQLVGPVPVSLPHADGPTERVLVRVPRTEGAQLARALKAAAAVRSARRANDTVRTELDPAELG